MGETTSTACQRLQEADQAYHDLMRGGMARVVTDENGEQISYSKRTPQHCSPTSRC
jgi:hypothetical protein